MITSEFLISGSLGNDRNEVSEELKNADYNDLDDMVFRLELTYIEIKEIPNLLPHQLLDILCHREFMKLVILI